MHPRPRHVKFEADQLAGGSGFQGFEDRITSKHVGCQVAPEFLNGLLLFFPQKFQPAFPFGSNLGFSLLLTSEFCAANPVETTDRGIAGDINPPADLRERKPLRVKFNESGVSLAIPHAPPSAGYG